MIYLIVGASCAGKSTLMRNTFLRGKVEHGYDLMSLSSTPYGAIIGTCEPKKGATSIQDLRTIGTDRISRAQIPDIPRQVERLLKAGHKNVVLDGAKACNNSTIEGLLAIGEPVTLVLVTCSLEMSEWRNLQNGSTCKPSSLKSARTRGLNVYRSYHDKVYKTIVIDTDNFSPEDFKNFRLDLNDL